jgi:hypothetical protein
MRKILLATVALLPLAACNPQTAPTTPSQVVADLQGVVTELATIEPLIVKAAPSALTAAQQATIASDIAQAQSTLTQLQAGLPAATGASVASTIDGYVNDAVGTLATVATSIPVLAPYAVPIDAIDAVLPAAETWINQYLPPATTAPTAAAIGRKHHPVSPHTVVWGRQTLHIPTVSQ